jgi:multimeric flavodoxin WrbA
MRITIVGVACSPRKDQSTGFALETCLTAARAAGVATVTIDLAGRVVNGCTACGHCNKQLSCSQKDDFEAFLPILTDPAVAGLIVATPVYFGTMTSQAKAFLDRCVMLRRNGSLLRDKVGGAIAVGGFRHGGLETTIQAIHAAMLIQDMILVGDGFSTFHFGGTLWSGHPQGYREDAFGVDTLRNLGKRVAGLATRLHGAPSSA